MKQVVFEGRALNDFNEWAVNDKKIYQKIKEIDRNPFVGIGKPEALKHDFAGYWSRRITDEHRLVYKIPSFPLSEWECIHYAEHTVPLRLRRIGAREIFPLGRVGTRVGRVGTRVERKKRYNTPWAEADTKYTNRLIPISSLVLSSIGYLSLPVPKPPILFSTL